MVVNPVYWRISGQLLPGGGRSDGYRDGARVRGAGGGPPGRVVRVTRAYLLKRRIPVRTAGALYFVQFGDLNAQNRGRTKIVRGCLLNTMRARATLALPPSDVTATPKLLDFSEQYQEITRKSFLLLPLRSNRKGTVITS